MEEIHLRLQTDLVWLTWIAFFIALPFYHFLRQRDPLIRWHEHGNVSTKPYGLGDLCGIVVFFMGMAALATMGGGDEAAELTTNILLTGGLLNIAVVCFFVMMWVWRKVDFVELFGLGRLTLAGVAIWGGVVGVISILLVMAVGVVSSRMLTPVLGELPPQPVVSAFLDSPDLAFRLIMLVTVVVIAPIFEEVMFRGYLYGVTKKFTDRFFAVAFSSSVFALVHSGAITVVPIFTLALFLTLAYELTGCLLVPITIHMLFNLANVVGMLFFPEAAAGS